MVASGATAGAPHVSAVMFLVLSTAAWLTVLLDLLYDSSAASRGKQEAPNAMLQLDPQGSTNANTEEVWHVDKPHATPSAGDIVSVTSERKAPQFEPISSASGQISTLLPGPNSAAARMGEITCLMVQPPREFSPQKLEVQASRCGSYDPAFDAIKGYCTIYCSSFLVKPTQLLLCTLLCRDSWIKFRVRYCIFVSSITSCWSWGHCSITITIIVI